MIHSHTPFFISYCAADHGYRYTRSFTHCCVSNDAYSFTHWCVSDHVYRYTHAFTSSLIAVCQITHTDTLTHSLHSLLCVKSRIQIHSHAYFTHCCQITHTNKLTHTLHSLLCVRLHKQIHSLTHFTHCCLSSHAYIYTLTQAYLQNCSTFWNQMFVCQCLTTKQSVVKRWVCTLQL